ncbi:translocation/assembly module TamB [Flavimarina sp. Hel_I_48]|uniref:translocation/assembly module TamB domain-containing protein n=1 Tax=Flavimarina sp. Hel_I_48 TaxID=1392488 RepID=UPI0004DF5C83|nr:translocation/assembly module TamB [Flavimarina sp. Hel_I_48]
MKNKKQRFLKIAKILGKILGVIFLLILLLILFIRSPWGQDIITNKVVSYVSDKTNTEVQIEKLYITFSGDILLNGLYLEDTKGDTLVYSRHLEADIPIWPIVSGGGIGVDNLKWEGVRAHVYRKDSVKGFNYKFLIDAFAAQDTITTTRADTSSMALSLGTFALADIQLDYNDAVSGMKADLKLGRLDLEMEETDLENMRFAVGSARLENTTAAYTLAKPLPETPPTDAPLPSISVELLELNNVGANYESVPDGLLADLFINEFQLELPAANLAENKIEVDGLALKKSQFNIERTVKSADSTSKSTENDVKTSFVWPDFDIKVGSIDFENNMISYTVNDAVATPQKFNPDAIQVTGFTLQAQDISYAEQKASLKLEQFTFSEASGIKLDQLAFDARATDEQITIEDLYLSLGQNTLDGKVALHYETLGQFIENPESGALQLDINKLSLDVATAFDFQPELRKNPYLKALAKQPVTGEVRASGKLSELQIPKFELNWGNGTSINANGVVYSATDPDKLRYDFPKIRVKMAKKDLLRFVNEDSLGISIPQDIALNADVAGTTEQVDAQANLNTSSGTIAMDVKAAIGDALAFDGKVNVDSLQLGQILKNDQMGALTLRVDAQGSGSDLSTLDAQLNAVVETLELNNYAIKDLQIKGNLKNGEGDIASSYKDDNLNADLKTHVILDTASVQAKIDLDVIGADLQALSLSSRSVKSALKLTANFEGDAENYAVNSQITEAVAVYDNKSYLFGDMDIKAFVKPDTTSVDIANRMLDLHLESNTDPATFTSAVQRHIITYLTDSPRTDTLTNPVKIKLRGTVSQAPVLTDVLVNGLQELDTVKIRADFDERNRKLSASINAPHINYGGNVIDSLAFDIDSDADALSFDFGLRELLAGPVNINRTVLKGRIADKQLNLDFTSYDDEEKLIHMLSRLTWENEVLQISIDPSELLLNKNPWEIDPSNKISLDENLTRFENFVLSRNDQQLQISNTMPGIQTDHIGIDFQNFRLATFLSYLNPDENLANGALNGTFIIEDPVNSPGLVADLKITDFKVIDVAMGTLALQANSENGRDYNFDLGIKGGAADLDLTGSYIADPEAAKLDLNLALNEVKMKTLEAFSFGELEEADGSLSGNIKVGGTTIEPLYEGDITFNNAGFKVSKLNSEFLLAQEEIKLDNAGIYFKDFKIQDAKQNAFSVDGSVGTEDLLVPTFDLNFKARNFQVLYSTKEDFDLFYGDFSFDADASLTGDLNLPKVDLDFTVGENTDFTYVLPASQAQIESMEGVVVFVNKENPDAILTQSEEESYTLTGVDVTARIKVNKAAIFNIIVDEQTGDNLRVQGDADLDFTMNPNGRMSLTGMYEIDTGHYELSLYNLVKRRFELAPGGQAVWSGDPFNAALNVSAYYNLETAATGLMPSSGNGNRFKQQLNFQVYLNIDGELMHPVISFNLDMPKDEQGAVGGQVYGRVQQLNQQENELNKQVFSLLVLNKFFPDSGSDGSSGGTASIARDNLNDAISDQLNTFSDKLLGNSGVELNFGLDSYTDYQGEGQQDRTTLDIAAQKKLLDDRLIVSVGSEVDIEGSPAASDGPSPVIGNVSLEYLLTEDGRYSVKGFRRNAFENVIDGQLIISGISLIFTREFDKFDDFWQGLFRPNQDQKENMEEKPKDEN